VLISSSHEGMQELMDSLCDFLLYHGVTISADEVLEHSKTRYYARNSSERLAITIFDRNSRPGKLIAPRTIGLPCESGKVAISISRGLALPRLGLDRRSRSNQESH